VAVSGDDRLPTEAEYAASIKEAIAKTLAMKNGAVTATDAPELGDALPTWEMEEPAPREWLVENFIPDRWPTLLYGDGGAGKTTLVTHLALHIAIGRDWFGRRTKQTNVLIVDAELDEIEAARRVWPLARGMSLDAPPQGVYYWRLPKALSDEDVLDHLYGLIVKHKIGFVVVDSLTIATHMSDQNVSGDLLKLVFALQKWGVPFKFIDHHAKSALNNDPESTSPYGSVYKRNAVRAMTYMQTGAKGSARLHCRKSNFGPKWEPFSIAAEWLGFWPNQSIVYQKLAENDPRNLSMKSEEVKNETVEALRALVDEYPEGIPTKAIADYLSISEDTARMRLMRAEKMRPPMASRVDRGKWLPINEPPPPEPNK
jgi:RecA-family ATPase